MFEVVFQGEKKDFIDVYFLSIIKNCFQCFDVSTGKNMFITSLIYDFPH